VRLVSYGLWVLRWPAAIYAGIYIFGAILFLLKLKIGSEDGKLVVDTGSWAYMIAHPMRYGGHRAVEPIGSICPFYARMLNMLLFVWPFLLIYFLLMLTAGNVMGLLITGRWIFPDLSKDGFIRLRPFFFDGIPTLIVTGSLALLALLAILAINGWRLLVFLATIGWGLLCLSPAIVAITIIIVAILYFRSGRFLSEPERGEQVSAAREVILAHKHKFCKGIKFK
jgi:hypothetical protein